MTKIVINYQQFITNYTNLLSLSLRNFVVSSFEALRRASPAFRSACTVDLLRTLLIVCGTASLLLVDMSALYHMIRVQAVVKIYILFNILEVFHCFLDEEEPGS